MIDSYLILIRVTIFSLGAILCYSMVLSGLTFKLLWLIILLCRRMLMSCWPRVPVNQLLLVLAFTLMCLWNLSILVVYDHCSVLNNSVPIWAYLLLVWPLSNRYGNSSVMMLSVLISMCIILLLSIITNFCICFAK